MTDYTGRFGIDPTDEPDCSEQIPEPEGWRHPFPDGSVITILDFEDPIVTGKRNSTAREVAKWIEENEADTDKTIEYITKNYKCNV